MIETMIFETSCAGCERRGAPLCTACRMLLAGRVPTNPPVGVIAALPYTGRVRDVVIGLKYRNRRYVARHLAGLLVNRLVADGAHRGVDVVTWAPTSRARRGHRGFDQSELIARTVARQLGLPVRRVLDRRGSAEAQTGRSRVERRHAPGFAVRPGLDGAVVLVVDDVVTTGATLGAARAALESAGADVVLAAVAATPERAVTARHRAMPSSSRLASVVPMRRPEVAAGGDRVA